MKPAAAKRAPVLGKARGRMARKARKEAGLTLNELSEPAGVSLRYISRMEQDRCGIPEKRLADLASALGVPRAIA